MTQHYLIETLLAQAGNRTDERTGAVSTPIFYQQLMPTMELVKVQAMTIHVRKIQHVAF